MNVEDLEQQILGDDARIKPDPQSLKDQFRVWIEPILVFLVVVLIGMSIWLLTIIGGLTDTVEAVQTEVDASSVERDRGAANTCRLLGALGLDLTDPESRCQDPDVQVIWAPYVGESTAAADAANTALIVACRIAAASAELQIPECLNAAPTGKP